MENVLASYWRFTFFLKVDWKYFVAFLKLTNVDFLNGRERIKFKDLINISAFIGNSVIVLTDIPAVSFLHAIKHTSDYNFYSCWLENKLLVYMKNVLRQWMCTHVI